MEFWSIQNIVLTCWVQREFTLITKTNSNFLFYEHEIIDWTVE